MAKTAAFGVMHLGIAFSVTYALTGSLTVAGAVTFVEPAVNMVAHYFFDKHWDDHKVEGWMQRMLRRVGEGLPQAGWGVEKALQPIPVRVRD